MGLSAVGLAGLYVYVAKPYVARHEWRESAQPTTIEVMYVAMACGEHSPRLYELVAGADGAGQWSHTPTLLALPDGMASPEDTQYAVGGNVFVLTGYRYRRRDRNILTGAVKTYRAPRFDVVSWQVRAPYEIWTASGDRVTRHEADGVAGNEKPATRFAMRNYHLC